MVTVADPLVVVMFAPVENMKGDTVLIKAQAEFADGYLSQIIYESIIFKLSTIDGSSVFTIFFN